MPGRAAAHRAQESCLTTPVSAELIDAKKQSKEDDYDSGHLTDPLAKKRLQNRLAQRAYRKYFLVMVFHNPLT